MRVAFVASLHAPVTDITSDGDHILVADLARALVEREHEVMVFGAQGSYLRDVPTTPLSVGRGYEQLLWHVGRWQPDVISQHAADQHPLASDFAPVVDARTAFKLRFVPLGVPEMPVRSGAPEPIGLISGKIAPRRGTADAIRAAKAAGLRPMLVGDVADRAYFAREVVPLLAGVNACGVLPRERIWALMARSAVTLLPLHSGATFSLAAAEAQAAGCPVVGYRTPLMSELVPADAGALVDEWDTDGLPDAVAAARALDRAAIRASARERFAHAAMIDAHEDLLLTTARVPSRRAA